MTRRAMPAHVQAALLAEGVINERRLTRTPQRRRCPNGCGRQLLASQDMGMEIWVDPLPVTALGELAAVMSGRRTFTFVVGEMAYRDPQRIAYRAAASGDEVYAEHRCDLPQPQPDPRRAHIHAKPDPTDAPPF